jgi:RNA polymerase sigma factor (sigma-70 family)
MSAPPPTIRLVPPAESHPALDPGDIEALYRRFAPYVARVASRVLGHGEDVDDLVHDVFIVAQRGVKALRKASSVKHWLATVAVRKARGRLRRRAILNRLGFGSDIDTETVIDPRASAESHAWVAAVYRTLDAMPVDARIAWVLFHVEHEPLERIGEVCGFSRATAHRRLREAEVILEQELGDGETN